MQPKRISSSSYIRRGDAAHRARAAFVFKGLRGASMLRAVNHSCDE